VKTLSSRWTVLTKWCTPVVWIALTIFLIVGGYYEKEEKLGAAYYSLVVVFGLFGLLTWWFMVRDLADEVVDCGDALLVRRGEIEEAVPLTNILRVSESPFSESVRVVVQLIVPGQFGRVIAFMPQKQPARINPFAKNPVVQDLANRVLNARDSARRESSARTSGLRPG